MIRKLSVATLVAALIGGLALVVSPRLQAPAEPTVQLPAGFAVGFREVFP